LYLHIGTEKTGTSSVQNFFSANRELLARKGILYPETPGQKNHIGLTAAAQSGGTGGPLRKILGLRSRQDVDQYRRDLVAGLESECAARLFTTAVMSNEHCSSRLIDDREVQWLKDFLSPHFESIKIIVYVRRQDDFLLSTYSTSVKSGATRELAIPQERLIQYRYDHWELLQRWARIFGRENVICRKYEKAALKDGDIVDDFLSVTGIASNPDFERPDDVNESLDAETLEFLRLFNKHVPRMSKDGINPERNNIVPLLSRMAQGPLITLEEDALKGFMELFRESNRKVAEEYFGGTRTGAGDPLFEPRIDSRPRTSQVTLTVERVVEICVGLWQEKQAQLDRVAERARRRETGLGPGGKPRKHAKDKDRFGE
jgi:hypothetical protein